MSKQTTTAASSRADEPKALSAGCSEGLAVPEKRAKVRACLRCSREFLSQGAHNRLCATCRAKSVSPYAL